MIETHKSFINRWESDENSHMNVQFYLKRFDEAATVLDTLAGTSNATSLVLRHIRFHRELHEGDGTKTVSGKAHASGAQDSIVHLMHHTQSGAICTTALDTLSKPVGADLPAPASGMMEAAQPRGLQGGPIEETDAGALLAEGKAVASNYSVVLPGEQTADGRMMSHRIVSRFTDGAPHVWDFAGADTTFLKQNNLGRVAVEMKVMPLGKVEIGEALRLISWVPDRKARTFRVSHQLESLATGNLIARGDVCCLLIDLSSRKTAPLPDTLRTVAD